jgi:CelD/BcsL family acetyltransferase involved in cellulose biosynthesis
LRADSAAANDLVKVAQELKCQVSCEPEDVSLELELPGTWEEFLGRLTTKERHETRRKLRRLHESARIGFRVVDDCETVEDAMDRFLNLFGLNRSDKAAFMKGRMASFFRSLAKEMTQAGILKLFFLELDTVPVAAVMCFDYHSTRYLYNNGYDDRFRALSVGLLSKVLSIKDGIQSGIKKYDFLKGTEVYKHRLGGQPIQLNRCRIEL